MLLLMAGFISLSCTSAYHGPLRFSYENRDKPGSDNKRYLTEEPLSTTQPSNPVETRKVTSINDRTYVVRRTGNNLWHLVEKPVEEKANNEVVSPEYRYRPGEQTDSTFCNSAINAFCEITEVLINLTGFNPIIRACLAIGLKFIKPLLHLMCNRPDNKPYPVIPSSRNT